MHSTSTKTSSQTCNKDNSKGSKKAALLVLKFTLPSIISSVLRTIVMIFFLRCRSRKTRTPAQEHLFSLTTRRRISYHDIQQATDGFNKCNLLGTGGIGSMYKDTLYDKDCSSSKSPKILSSYCDPDFKALVLEFMPNGSLEKWLYSHNYFLDTLKRCGSALEYLCHGHLSASVIHCDLMPNNILLDENMVPHANDFGISKFLSEGEDSMTRTMTMATIGYMAPEYGSEGIISAKCDIYSYCALLMETFTRKTSIDEMFTGEISLRD
ncbi:hypothetical protein CUMW_247340 [Citrus unshiu]|uniref:Protein kinase domain-containing protein n=1 Tax=Citrus unshiu TaxID=55188 RepID=A0A2H5QNR7_CITUN|nr:hypothetical protein CUMW_247340 [Citrus unshiu]